MNFLIKLRFIFDKSIHTPQLFKLSLVYFILISIQFFLSLTEMRSQLCCQITIYIHIWYITYLYLKIYFMFLYIMFLNIIKFSWFLMSSRHYQQVGTALSSQRQKFWSQKGRGRASSLRASDWPRCKFTMTTTAVASVKSSLGLLLPTSKAVSHLR